MVTWMQVMVEARRLDDKRKSGERLNGEDSAGLVSMLLNFHDQAVEKVPEPSRPALRMTGQRHSRRRDTP
jgi:hypothetical protein